MRKTTIFALTAMAVMLISVFAPIAFATGPPQGGINPVDTHTLYVGSAGWGPYDADPAYAYDTASGELLFNSHDTLLSMGEPVSNQFGTNWDVQEQYFTFSPSLATDVPTRVQVLEDFNQNQTFGFEIVILNEEILDMPFPLPLPIGTFWDDAHSQPIFSYKIMSWVDTNQDGVLSPSDLVELNIYHWAPALAGKVLIVQEHWFHVEQVDQLGQGPPFAPFSIRLHLSLVADPDAVPPVCYWFTSPQNPGFVFHLEGWVDNRPDEILNNTDVVYLSKYQIVPVVWDKIGAGFEYVKVTAYTYELLYATQTPPLSLHTERYYYDFNIRTTYHVFNETMGRGDGVTTTFSLAHQDLVPLSDTVRLNLTGQTRGVDYTIDDLAGTITFTVAPSNQYFIYADYDAYIDFFDEFGAIVDRFDIYDAEYSFKSGLIQDQGGSPVWMFYKPFFDQMNSDWWDTGKVKDAITLTWLIHDSVEIMGPTTLRLKLGIAFPDVAFKQIITQTWSVMQSKQWSIGRGMYNPDDIFLDENQDSMPDWFVDWRHMPVDDPIDPIAPENYVGTGPYHVSIVSQANGIVVLERNPNYWGGWPAPNRKSYLDTIDIEYISLFPARKAAFDAGEVDVCYVPRAYINQLLDPIDTARMTTLIPGEKTIKNISPALTEDNLFFGFTVSNVSVALYTGKFPDGAPYDFFNNTHVRKAFAYAFNHTKYLNEVYLGEAISRQTVTVYGLVPDYYSLPDKAGLGPWTLLGDIDLSKMKSELEQAMFTQDGVTKSVWEWGGFHLIINWNSGNDLRKLAGEFIKGSFDALNAQYGKNFQVTVQMELWGTILGQMRRMELPIWFIGWLADFADVDNWVRPYMHTNGDFSGFQNYSIANGWTTPGPITGLNKDQLIDLAVKTPDGPERAAMYSDLDQIFVADVPDIPIAQGLGRRWTWYWVKGWYYNALYPSQYYYKLYKENACWADVTGPLASYLPNQPAQNYPEGVDNMRDIGYIANHFGAKAPDPAKTPPYDNKWAPGVYGAAGADVYGDRKIDMRDIGFAAAHFGDTTEP